VSLAVKVPASESAMANVLFVDPEFNQVVRASIDKLSSPPLIVEFADDAVSAKPS
jgi:hypothetical protein